MPYVDPALRQPLLFRQRLPETAGELNFVITTLLLDYVTKHGKSYQTINDIGGVMLNCYLEFYRRLGAPYEDIKIKDNGDVY